MKNNLIIIGAGPIGIEAAIYAIKAGYEVTVLEKGSICNNLKKWGHITLFSPFYLNSSKLGLEILKEAPETDIYQTGYEYFESYLLPITKTVLQGKIRENTEVTGISRKNVLKGDLIGKAERNDAPFIISIKDEKGESFIEADIVIDASGTYDTPRNIGIGGLRVPGELSLRDKISHNIPDINNTEQEKYSDKTTLLIGSGYSAATSINHFSELLKKTKQTKLIWLTRKNKVPPYTPIENDALPLRAKLINDVNNMVESKNPQLEYYPLSQIYSIEFIQGSKLKVNVSQNGELKDFIVDEIIANVGYKPDNSIYEELQIHECYASQGPMKLAASLLSSDSTDCLTQSSAGADTLKNPEPNFYIIGSKSYGRGSAFLLKLGYEQIRDIFTLITNNPEYNLYK